MEWIGLGLIVMVVTFGLGALLGLGIRLFKKSSPANRVAERQLSDLTVAHATLRSQFTEMRERMAKLEAQIHAVHKGLSQTTEIRATARPRADAAQGSQPLDSGIQPARSSASVAPPDRQPCVPDPLEVTPIMVPERENPALPNAVPALHPDVEFALPPAADAPGEQDMPVGEAALLSKPVPACVAAPAPPKPARPASPKVPPAPPAPPTWLQTAFRRWVVGGNPLVKIGVLILFLGLAFLLRYAAAHAVLPVEYRYAGVAASAIGLLLMGWRWRRRADKYGLILQGAGVGVMYLTTLAAMKLHPLIPPAAGLMLLIAVAGFAALLAIAQDALVLAIIGTLGGFAAPVLASTGGGNHVMLFSYLALLSLGIVAIAWFKAWRSLNLIGFTCSFGLGAAWAARSYEPQLYASTQPFLFLLFGLYVLITGRCARPVGAALSRAGAPGRRPAQLRRRHAGVWRAGADLWHAIPAGTGLGIRPGV